MKTSVEELFFSEKIAIFLFECIFTVYLQLFNFRNKITQVRKFPPFYDFEQISDRFLKKWSV